MGRAYLPPAIRMPPSIRDSSGPNTFLEWSILRFSDRWHQKGAAAVTAPIPHSNRHSESGSLTRGQALMLIPVFWRRAGATRVPPIYATWFLDGRQIEYSLSTDCAQSIWLVLILSHQILTANVSRALALILEGRLPIRIPSALHKRIYTWECLHIFGVVIKSTGSEDRPTGFKSLLSVKYLCAELWAIYLKHFSLCCPQF